MIRSCICDGVLVESGRSKSGEKVERVSLVFGAGVWCREGVKKTFEINNEYVFCVI